MVIIFNLPTLSIIFQPELNSIYFEMFANYKFWMMLVGIPFVCLIPDVFLKVIYGLFWKNPAHVMMMIEKSYPCKSFNIRLKEESVPA
jgi:hypothetical protein